MHNNNKSIQDLIDSGFIDEKYLNKKKLYINNDIEFNARVNIRDFKGIEKFESLSELYIEDLEIKNLNDISKLKKLKTLRVTEVTDLFYLSTDLDIEHLDISYSSLGGRKLDFLKYFTKIKTLNIRHPNMKPIEPLDSDDFDLSHIKQLKTLESFHLYGINLKIENLDFLNESVRYIRFEKGIEVDSLKGIERFDLNQLQIPKEYYIKVFKHEDNLNSPFPNMMREEDINFVRNYEFVNASLKPGDDLRGAASIMDTGLFDFKIK